MKKQYTPTERLGVNAVERMFLHIGWIFREQHTTDVGIDAQVEICEDGVATGKVLAIQIKSGASYFRQENASGYVYHGDGRHLDYWLQHSLPVLLVLYDPTEDRAWWCSLHEENVTREANRWSTCVPKVQELTQVSRDALRRIAMPRPLNQSRLRDIAARLSDRAAAISGYSSLLDALHAADSSIDVIAPVTDEMLFLALAFCSHRVRVRLITGPTVPEAAVREFLSGDHEGIDWKCAMSVHEKLIVIDDFLVVLGSANMTLASWRSGWEYVQCVCEPNLSRPVIESFEEVWLGQRISLVNVADLVRHD